MKIFLVLTVYNEIKYGPHIELQLDDAVKRDYDGIVLLDDGSDDGTWDVIQQYRNKYNKIHAIRNEQNSVLIAGENRWMTLMREVAKFEPTWIHFRACDQIHSKQFNNDVRKKLENFIEKGVHVVQLPCAHLWRSRGWIRSDGVWGNDYRNATKNQILRFNKNYYYAPRRHKAKLHMGGHLPNKLGFSEKIVFRNFNIDENKLKGEFPKYIVLHLGHTSYEKKAQKFRWCVKASVNSEGMPCEVPTPTRWLSYNGYKGFHEFDIELLRSCPEWFEEPLTEEEKDFPTFKSFYELLKKYDLQKAELYKTLFNNANRKGIFKDKGIL